MTQQQGRKFAKTIKIFLIDGDPGGRMSCELSQWTGKAYKIPRSLIPSSGDREDLKKSGVYLLFGKNELDENLAYIGESECVYDRLKQQLQEKEFWTECIAFISKDENLNKAHIKYLENRLYQVATHCNRYNLNQSVPAKASISEPETAEMEEFVDNLCVIVNTLGHKIFEEKPSISDAPSRKFVFSYSGPRYSEAKGMISSEGFVVFKGSKASLELTESMSKGYKNLREKLISKGILKNTGNCFEFVEDYIFTSSTAAIMIIAGSPGSGPALWKNDNNKSLREVEGD